MTWFMVPTPGTGFFVADEPLSITGDETYTTTPYASQGSESLQLLRLTNDTFAYNPASPTSPMPDNDGNYNWFHGYTELTTIAYDLNHTFSDIVVDLYGRHHTTASVEERDDSFDIEFRLGGVLQETIAGSIDADHHDRVIASPGTNADSIRIVETAAEPAFFTLVELRVTGTAGPPVNTDTSIGMIASEAVDPSGVEYYFDCTGGSGTDSGWQDSRAYTDMGLSSGTTYTYRVQARDKSENQNAAGYSDPESATTDDCPADIDGDGDADEDDLAILIAQWLQVPGVPSADIYPSPVGDDFVDILDFATLSEHWLDGVGP
jgi:hypothetical protein